MINVKISNKIAVDTIMITSLFFWKKEPVATGIALLVLSFTGGLTYGAGFGWGLLLGTTGLMIGLMSGVGFGSGFGVGFGFTGSTGFTGVGSG